ncbi:MAG: hypothetical protein ACYC6V_01215 [Bacillota bacterium]
MQHIRNEKPQRPCEAPPGAKPQATLRKVASILSRHVLPAVCVRSEVFASTLTLLPVTVGQMRDSSWMAVEMVLRVTDGREAVAARHLASAARLAGTARTGGLGGTFLVALHSILKGRRLVRAALTARLRACRERPPAAGRLSAADWETVWALYFRPMLALEMELARLLDDLTKISSPEGGVRPGGPARP